MFFIIGGITPKTKRVDDQPIRCPHCGLNRAYRTRVDHWLHLFFIPVFPVQRGEEMVVCERCNGPVNGRLPSGAPFRPAGPDRCPACGKDLQDDFRFCPHCGQRLSKKG